MAFREFCSSFLTSVKNFTEKLKTYILNGCHFPQKHFFLNTIANYKSGLLNERQILFHVKQTVYYFSFSINFYSVLNFDNLHSMLDTI